MFGAVRSFLYASTPASFESRYGVAESVARLRAATVRTVFGALTGQAAVGKVSEDRVSLQRVIPFVGNSFKPFFVGRFERSAGGSILVGHFTMHWAVKAFNTFWFGFCLLWTALALAGSISSPKDAWHFPLFGLGLFCAGCAAVQAGKWFARNDVAWLSNVISSALSGTSAATRR